MPNSINALTETIFYILLSMTEPLHGYAVVQKVKDLSDGRVVLGTGTLYGAIENLMKKGWIIEVPGKNNVRGKKEYRVTEDGGQILKRELNRLRELVKNGELILENSGGNRK
ncbi:MAG: PadR family transcriptional regulator [Oscillospiraceae bacterium]|nr:PadR family transcriptional regulator [Oscillospiraceae bacterium]